MRTAGIAAAGAAAVSLLLAGALQTGAEAAHRKAPLRVGLVVLPANPGVLTTDPIVGLRRAIRELGVRATVLTPTVKEGFAPGLTTLARQGYDLVIGISILMGHDIEQVATRFPKTRFVLIDASSESLTSVLATSWGSFSRSSRSAISSVSSRH